MSEICADPLSLLLYLLTSSQDERCAPYMTWVVQVSRVEFLAYLEVLVKTIALEAPFYLFLLWQLRPWWKIPVALVIANLATHPIVYFGIPWICEKAGWEYSTLLILAEVFAPFLEILVIRFLFKTRWGLTIFWIVLANLFSWWVGVLLTYG